MTLAYTRSVALQGITGTLVTIEADCGPGLPGISVVGLADAVVDEAKDRMKTAARNGGLEWPRTKIVVSLSPASLRKTGSSFDLAIALAVLGCTAFSADALDRLSSTVFLGELGLDGDVKAVHGILPSVLTARDAGAERVVIPADNAAEAALVSDIETLGVTTLAGVWEWVLTGRTSADVFPIEHLSPTDIAQRFPAYRLEDTSARPDMSDIIGQDDAKHAIEVAAIGGHHLLMIGPPGAGKSMIAACMPTILPPLTEQECVESTAVHSTTKLGVVTEPPFVSPHFSTTAPQLIGGGHGVPRPGAVSMAHNGVLFLDEVGEMKPGVLDALRTPIELGEVRLLRNNVEVRYPSRCQVIMATNPCPCGAATAQSCRCSSTQRRRYLAHVSGPLLDRIDIAAQLVPTKISTMGTEESSATVRHRVAIARQWARARWRDQGARVNAQVAGSWIRQWLRERADIAAYLDEKLARAELSQRGVDRAVKVAFSLADQAAAVEYAQLQASTNPRHDEAAPNIASKKHHIVGDVLRLHHVTLDHIDQACSFHRLIDDPTF